MHYLTLIMPPDPPGVVVNRVLSSGIGVVVPKHWKEKFLPRNGKKPQGRELPSLETLYAAAVAEQAGAKVALLDIGLERWLGEDAVHQTLTSLPKTSGNLEDVLWLGIQINMPTLLQDLAFAQAIKAGRKDARVFLFGSPVMTTLDHWVKQVAADDVDAVIYGELEEVIAPMLQAPGATGWKAVPGVIDPKTYKVAGEAMLFDKGIVTSFDKWVRVKQLGSLPAPAWHLIPFERYSATGDPKDCGVHVQASRGCPIGCTMCPYMIHEGRPFRASPVDRVVTDLKSLNDTYGITHVRFRDPNFGFDKRMMVELANKLIETGVKIDAAAELSLELLDFDQIELLNRAGIKTILTGIESNDESCLASIGQKIKINENLEKKIAYCNTIGTQVFASFIVGAPEESWETVERTIKYAAQIDAQSAATIMTPFPGTPMFYRAIEEGLLKPEMRYNQWNSYTATMRSQFLSCGDLNVARLWFRLETLIPFKVRRARKTGSAADVLKTHVSLAPHYRRTSGASLLYLV